MERARDEADLRTVYPDVVHRVLRCGTIDRYEALVPVNGYEPRHVAVEIGRLGEHVAVFADGPVLSPHRYHDRGGRRLCLWYPSDPASQRWVSTDGLVALFALAAAHLFREAWWREHRQWLGEEAPHGQIPSGAPNGRGTPAVQGTSGAGAATGAGAAVGLPHPQEGLQPRGQDVTDRGARSA